MVWLWDFSNIKWSRQGKNNLFIYTFCFELNILNAQYVFACKIDDIVHWQVENEEPKAFVDVFMYIADPWYEAAHGTVKDLTVKTTTGRQILNFYTFSTKSSCFGITF